MKEPKLNREQERLRVLHGTPEAFRKAVMADLGEISLEEANAAVAKYMAEWNLAGWKPTLPPRWVKIVIDTEPKTTLRDEALFWTRTFEARFKVQALYFTRDANSRWEIVALCHATDGAIRRFFLRCKLVTAVAVQNIDGGSYPRAHAYQAAKRLGECDFTNVHDVDLRDVVHSLCNMRGYDLAREVRFYALMALTYSCEIMDNAEAAARQEEATDLEKAPEAAEVRQPSPRPKRPRRARAVERTADAQRPRSRAGSGPR